MKTMQELPTLIGTEKQVAWAEKIRTSIITENERQIGFWQSRVDAGIRVETAKRMIAALSCKYLKLQQKRRQEN